MRHFSTFTISTNRTGIHRWWRVQIHPNVEALREVLRDRGIDTEDVFAYFLPAGYRPGLNGCEYPSDGYAGDILFAEPWLTPQIKAHELVHAAVATYRMTNTRSADLGDRYGQAEETLAHIHGDLFADLERKLGET